MRRTFVVVASLLVLAGCGDIKTDGTSVTRPETTTTTTVAHVVCESLDGWTYLAEECRP